MIVQRYKMNLEPTGDKYINIPINIDFDYLDRENDISSYRDRVIRDIIGNPIDFEVQRFTHEKNPTDNQTKLLHEFYFFQSNNQYKNTYLGDFEAKELYFYANSFTNSFFKLDFYDSPDTNNQTNYITQIIPVQQGDTENVTLFRRPVKVRKPNFKLDFIGDKEGFFVYWLKKKTFLNISNFYVSAKFFDAKRGIFSRFMNNSNIVTKNFNQAENFYYKYELNDTNKTFQVFQFGLNLTSRAGIEGNPIKWYEYINP